MADRGRRTLPHMSHWGAFRVTVDGDDIVAVDGHPDDPAPTPLLANYPRRHQARRSRGRGPRCGAGWLEHGPGPDDRRGADDFVEVEWAEALDLVAGELQRVRVDARQRGDLRRLVRLGERGPVPPRAESAPPVPELHRRLHRVGQQLLARRVRSDRSRTSSAARTKCCAARPRGRRSSSTPSSSSRSAA